MKNKEMEDIIVRETLPGRKTLSERLNTPAVIFLCVSIATSSWAISGELHNYRLQNISDRLKAHETSLQEGNAERGELRRLDRNIALLESLGPAATAAQCLAVALAIEPRRR